MEFERNPPPQVVDELDGKLLSESDVLDETVSTAVLPNSPRALPSVHGYTTESTLTVDSTNSRSRKVQPLIVSVKNEANPPPQVVDSV